MSTSPFEDLVEAYEALIEWKKRLAHEEPFYRRWFEEIGVKRVLDAACGTGHHAAMFHDWGLAVEGADISPAMIQRCRAAYGESENLHWSVRGFGEPVPNGGGWDAVVCVGNSLALAEDQEAVATSLREMLAAVRPGGLLVVQVLNIHAMPDGPCLWQKVKRVSLAAREALLVKGVHRCGGRGYVELIIADPDAQAPPRFDSVAFLGLEAEDLVAMARQAGAEKVDVFGGYQNKPFRREQSVDLVVVGRRA